MRKDFALVLSIGLLATGVAACGGSSGSSSSASNTSAAVAAAATTTTGGATTATSSASHAGAGVGSHASSKLSISAPKSGALMFSTAHLSAKAGTVVVTFTNNSPEDHNFTVVQGTDGSMVGATPTFSGGSKTLTLHLKAGKYTYYCSVPGHRQAGMEGTLTVT